MFRVSNGITSAAVPTDEALRVWEETKPHLRSGDPDTGFIVWPESAFGGRITCAGIAYTPLPDDEPAATHLIHRHIPGRGP